MVVDSPLQIADLVATQVQHVKMGSTGDHSASRGVDGLDSLRLVHVSEFEGHDRFNLVISQHQVSK